MRTTTALALAAILTSTALLAQTDEWKGKQGAAGASAPRVRAGAGRSFASCAMVQTTQLNDLRVAQVARRLTVPELNVVVDFNKDTVAGSMVLPPIATVFPECPPPKLLECGKLKVEEGRTQGRTFTFTTYRTIDGARIPTHWEGEALSDGGLSYRSIDPVPCPVPESLISSSGQIPLSAPAGSSLVYRRGDGSQTAKTAGAPNATGKWWTIDGRRVWILALKAGSKGQLSGSINLCGSNNSGARTIGELQVEKGSVSGKNISFETHGVGGSQRLQWTGELVDSDTLRLSNPIHADPCGFTAAVTLTLRQPK